MAQFKNTLFLTIALFALAFGPISIDASGATPQDGCTQPPSTCGG